MSETIITPSWSDPGDAPALPAEWFVEAKAERDGVPVARRGRPPLATSKQLVSLRLDREIVERLRATGPGWQTRVNAALRRVVGL